MLLTHFYCVTKQKTYQNTLQYIYSVCLCPYIAIVFVLGKLSTHYHRLQQPNNAVISALMLWWSNASHNKQASKHIAIHVFWLFMPSYGTRFGDGKVEYSLSQLTATQYWHWCELTLHKFNLYLIWFLAFNLFDIVCHQLIPQLFVVDYSCKHLFRRKSCVCLS